MEVRKPKRLSLREVREALGYSTEKLSELCGEPILKYKLYEENLGSTPACVAHKISCILGISLDVFEIKID